MSSSKKSAKCGSGKKDGGSRDIESAAILFWETASVFSGAVTLDDVLESAFVETTFDGTNWIHEITFEYKPESPIDHETFSNAGNLLEGTTVALSVCGCESTAIVSDHHSFYSMATPSKGMGMGMGMSMGKGDGKGKCQGASTAGSSAGKRRRRNRHLTKTSTNSPVAVKGVIGLIGVATVMALVVLRQRAGN